eukprot:TRINITY_DN8057_c0_g1_i1.p2 TRINITY_DN8057_c0_g1~~TRINITY_DN8057_c0_g1_i1.p2  ORF type:complete len:190 (+),score=29.64 TRINITY_DN8057_c0_g1_i1:902-1471(+)
MEFDGQRGWHWLFLGQWEQQSLVVIDPKQLQITNTLFLAKGNLALVSNLSHTIHDVVIANNRWSSESKFRNESIVVSGSFTNVTDVIIENNIADSFWHVKSTRATRSVTVNPSQTIVSLDYSNDLLFPAVAIQLARCDLETAPGAPVVPVSTSPVAKDQPLKLNVNLGGATTGRVTCTVDQNFRIHAGH